MLYRFVCPDPERGLLDFAIEAEDFHAAFREFAMKHWDFEQYAEFGVWQGGKLIAVAHTAIVLTTWKISPVYNWVEPKGLPHGLERPSEN